MVVKLKSISTKQSRSKSLRFSKDRVLTGKEGKNKPTLVSFQETPSESDSSSKNSDLRLLIESFKILPTRDLRQATLSKSFSGTTMSAWY